MRVDPPKPITEERDDTIRRYDEKQDRIYPSKSCEERICR
jgi:hypothetical protein